MPKNHPALSMTGGMGRRILSLSAVVALLLALAPAAASARHRGGACAGSHASVSPRDMRQARRATLCLLNKVRRHAGLHALRLNPTLTHVAGGHSRDMVRHGYFAHDSLNGASPFDRILGAHYVPRNGSWWLGENIGYGGGPLATPAALVRMWMHSPPHRANILSSHFRAIGVGIALGMPVRGVHAAAGGGATYTTDFGSRS